MPRIEFESPEQKQRFDSWIGRHIFDGRFVGGSIIPLGSDGRGSLEIYPTKDDAIVVVDEASDYILRKPVLVTSESFMEELKAAGVIFEKRSELEHAIVPDSNRRYVPPGGMFK